LVQSGGQNLKLPIVVLTYYYLHINYWATKNNSFSYFVVIQKYYSLTLKISVVYYYIKYWKMIICK